MYDFFKEIALESEEKLPEKRIDSIKSAVLSRIKEENSMKKISAFKTFSIAAIVAATAAMSAMLASAEKPASLPTKQSDTETESYIQTYLNNGKWIDLELPNGEKTDFFVPDGKVPMSFDRAQAAVDYVISHSEPSQDGYVVCSFSFDGCGDFAVILVDA